MPAAIVFTAGDLLGETFALPAPGELTIGRDAELNTVVVTHPAVSRAHCRLARDAQGAITLTDLESRNGTFVNERPVRERLLRDGDEIRVGNSRILLLMRGEDWAAAGPPSVRLAGQWEETGSPEVSREESIHFYLGGEGAGEAAPLRALVRLAAAIQSERNLEKLARRVLEACLELLPADQGAVILEGVELESAITWNAAGGCLEIPAGMIERVRTAKMALAGSGMAAAMAAPLGGDGVLYLAAADPRQRFGEKHLQLLAAAASLAGPAIENARAWERLESERARLADALHLDMVGEGARMREIYRFVERAALVDSTVLILGESGTGKELVARAIHRNGGRAAKPFVAVNCAALPDQLLESELFGHERGAFTGAVAQKKGRFEQADGGTLFLDEIGEMALPLQAKLLRALQERTFERLGGTRPIPLDARVLAATNRQMRGNPQFRQDLYFRLNVLSVTMPPLRERREDIPLLASHFVNKYARRMQRAMTGVSSRARACLMAYSWPGNVRELENAIERAVVMGSSELVQPEDLPVEITDSAGAAAGVELGNFHEEVRRAKEQLILNAVEQAKGNMVEAGRLLGLHPNYLHRLITNLGLRPLIRA